MKVGDLVKLSSYGRRSNQNADCYGGWGLITKVESSHLKYPIKTHWFKRDGRELEGMIFHARELKKYKPDKK
jgi:uncharacterized protein YodC (DUF2158 family)